MADQTTIIPKGWKMTTLGEVAEITSSKRIFAEEYKTFGIPFFRGKEITEKFNGNNISTELFISEEKYNDIKNNFGVPEENDLLLTSVGTLGNPYLVEKDLKFYFKDGNLTWFRNYKDLLPKFLFYWIISPQGKEILSYAKIGSTQEAYTISKLKGLSLTIPELPEQRAIAAVLSSLDDKIELLREQNKTLEATAQAIFKEWFVNFNFPGATGRMVDSELGEIPEGWRVGTVNDVITRHTITYRCDADDLSKVGKTPIIDQGSNGLYGYTEREPDFEASTKNPVILFTNHTCNMWFINYPFCAIQNVIPFRGNAEYSSFFVYYMTLGRVTFIEYKGHWPDFEQKEYLIPTPELANKFAEVVKPLQYKIWNNNSQIQTLSTLRDTFLPKLMKGEVRVAGFNN